MQEDNAIKLIYQEEIMGDHPEHTELGLDKI